MAAKVEEEEFLICTWLAQYFYELVFDAVFSLTV